MDSHNGNQQNDQSQNELDLGLHNTDSKNSQGAGSLLDKAKGLFAKKEQAQTQFHVRKEPTFGTQNEQPQTLQTSPFEEQPLEQKEEFIDVKEPQQVAQQSAPFVAAASNVNKVDNLKQPEKWKVLQILPEKHRRLFIAILGLVILLIVFFSLKPSSDTVESFEQQNTNEIPVQFQSLDQSQPVETSILDNSTTAPTSAEQTKSDVPPAMEYVGNSEAKNETVNPQTVETHSPTMQQPSQPIQAPVAQTTAKESPKHTPAVEKQTAPIERKVESHREHAVTSQEKKNAKPTTEKTAATTPVMKKESSAKIQESKPTVTQAATNGTSKTLTVPQGVSLMQVFRDNKLNIADVNAMTKASGAGNALSNFKPGDKVQVSLDGQGRVSELRLSNGTRFIRQANGSYQYKK